MSHVKEVGETYLKHLLFAWGVGIRLAASVVFFFIHGLVPYIRIPTKYNLGRTVEFLQRKNIGRTLRRREIGKSN